MRSIVSQSEQFGLPEHEAAVTPTKAEMAEIMRPRGGITSGLLNTAAMDYREIIPDNDTLTEQGKGVDCPHCSYKAFDYEDLGEHTGLNHKRTSRRY